MKVLSLVSYPSSFYREQVAGLEKQNITVDTISATDLSSHDKTVVERLPGVGKQSPLNYAYRGLSFYPRVLSASLSDYDIVHANSGMTAPFALAQPSRPVVMTLWGSDLMGDRLFGHLSKVTLESARRADETIVMSEEMDELLPFDAHVIPTGVDFDKFRPMDKADAKARVGWDDDSYDVIWPYPKDRAVKNYPLARDVAKNAENELGEGVTLRTIRGVNHGDMPIYYNAADVLLMTSKREGSPNTVKEALACNLPVVSTDVGDVRDRVSDLELSTVAESTSGLVAGLIAALTNNVSPNGRVESRGDISQESVSEQIINVYQDALS